MPGTDQGKGVAPRLYELLVQLFAVEPPMRLVGWDGSTAGAAEGPTLQVRSRRAVRRLLWNPGELGLARAYVSGEIDVEGDLTAGLRTLAEYGVLVGGKPALTASDRREVLRTAVLLGAVGPAPRPPPEERLLFEGRVVGSRGARGARELAAAVVPDDGGMQLMGHVLGESLAYSCAYWGEVPHGPAPDGIEAAQRAKLDLVCDRLGLEADVVRRRLVALGLSDRAEVRLGDVDAVDDGPYDAIGVLESIEHVRSTDLVAHMARLQNLLRPGGRLLIQALTRRSGPVQPGPAFMTAYVMPEGPLPPIGDLVSAVEDAGLEVRLVESWRDQYPRTLQAWLHRVDEHHATARDAVGETRLRVWRLSLALSTVGFERDRIGAHQLLAVWPHADGRSGMLG